MKKMRVGIVGCGRIASLFEDWFSDYPVSIAGAFDQLEETELVAACNRGEERLKRFGERWHVNALYRDYTELLAKEPLDILAVATNPPSHCDIIQCACAAGVKGIFCEKPMALNLADCDKIIESVNHAGVKLLVNCSRRFNGDYESARRIVMNQELGALIQIVGHCQGIKPTPDWCSDTEGPLLHDGVHLFDIMRFFAGTAESLIGSVTNKTRRFRFEDTSHSVIKFKNGVEGIALVDEMAAYGDFSVALNFSHGRIVLGDRNCSGLYRAKPDPSSREEGVIRSGLQRSPLPEPAWPGTSMRYAARNLVEAVLHDVPIRCDAYDGRAAVEIITAIYEAQLTDGRVCLPLQTQSSPLEQLRANGVL